MRIISGKLKSVRFQPPKSFLSRPTTDFAKEALFNVLGHRLSLYDLDVLDLFAGTGSISFEFASREVGRITLVEQNFKCVRFIKEQAKKYNIEDDLTVVKGEVITFLQKNENSYDIIFADPPFDFKKYDEIVDVVFQRELLDEGGLLIIEHSKRTDLSDLTGYDETKSYGGVSFSFFTNKD